MLLVLLVSLVFAFETSNDSSKSKCPYFASEDVANCPFHKSHEKLNSDANPAKDCPYMSTKHPKAAGCPYLNTKTRASLIINENECPYLKKHSMADLDACKFFKKDSHSDCQCAKNAKLGIVTECQCGEDCPCRNSSPEKHDGCPYKHGLHSIDKSASPLFEPEKAMGCPFHKASRDLADSAKKCPYIASKHPKCTYSFTVAAECPYLDNKSREELEIKKGECPYTKQHSINDLKECKYFKDLKGGCPMKKTKKFGNSDCGCKAASQITTQDVPKDHGKCPYKSKSGDLEDSEEAKECPYGHKFGKKPIDSPFFDEAEEIETDLVEADMGDAERFEL